MSRERTNPHTADATAFGRAWTAIRALPGVLQAALMVLVLLVVASPFVIAGAITSWTSSPRDAVGAGGQTADLSFDEANDEVVWRVVNVVDGDTLDACGIDGTEERVRVIGIDTPERGGMRVCRSD